MDVCRAWRAGQVWSYSGPESRFFIIRNRDEGRFGACARKQSGVEDRDLFVHVQNIPHFGVKVRIPFSA